MNISEKHTLYLFTLETKIHDPRGEINIQQEKVIEKVKVW